MEPQIVRSESLAHQVYRYLKDAILTGSMNAGERIVETRIATDLNTSRSPVREALRMLAAESLIAEVNGVLQVFNPSREDFRELYELRLALESEAARLAASRVNANVLSELEDNIEATRECITKGENEKLIRLNSEFHGMILHAAANRRILQARDNIEALVDYYSYMVFRKNNMKTNILSEHTKIYETLREGSPQRAYDAMYEHIQIDLTILQSRYEQAKLSERVMS